MSNRTTLLAPLSGRPRGTRAWCWKEVDLPSCMGIVLIFSSFVGHWIVGLQSPLWFDEAGTAAFASSDTFSDLIDYAYGDSNAPLYYLIIWLWAKCFGNNNLALHILSLAFSILAPLSAWMGLRGLHPRQALVWSASLALWGPGIILSGYARCYSLLVFTSVVSVITFIRLMQSPTLGRAFAWVAFASITTLVHYDAIFMVTAQAAMLVLSHRAKLLRLLPATLAFLPMLAWLLWHLPRLISYASPEHAWYRPLDVFGVFSVAAYIVGVPVYVLPVYLSVILGCLIVAVRQAENISVPRSQNFVRNAGFASLIACAVVVVIGAIRPSFTMRYITPFEPGILLLLAYYVVEITFSSPFILSMIMLCHNLSACALWAYPEVLGPNSFEYETASAWIAETKPSHLVFLWDNPSAVVVPRKQLEVMGGVFFHRIGRNISVTALFPQRGSDMNRQFATGLDRESAGLWIYDTSVHDTTAIVEPPRLGNGNDMVECRQFGKFSFVIQACRPRPM